MTPVRRGRPRTTTDSLSKVDADGSRLAGSPRSSADRQAQLSSPDSLEQKILTHSATVGVVGQGYVGFPLAQCAARTGFRTFGVDIDPAVVSRCLSNNESDLYGATADPVVLKQCDVILIAVPTPTRVHRGARRSDLSLVTAATEMIAEQISDDDRPRLVVSESTYAPGTTRSLVMPILCRTRAHESSVVAVGYSPERIDPGNQHYGIAEIPKVTSGADEYASALTTEFYRQIVDRVVPASSMEAAEATKLLENAFRFVNIAFAHEFDDYCTELGLSSHEITHLAATKPFGFLPFFAGAGIGGHCIAEDPYFLHDSMEASNIASRLLETAMDNHENRAAVVARRIVECLGGRPTAGARILVLGVAYKPNIGDTRRSPALPIMTLLEEAGACVDYYDPFVPTFAGKASIDIATADPTTYDLAVFLTEHRVFDPEAMRASGWNVFRFTSVPERVEVTQ